jgi:hypothetical protein
LQRRSRTFWRWVFFIAVRWGLLSAMVVRWGLVLVGFGWGFLIFGFVLACRFGRVEA